MNKKVILLILIMILSLFWSLIIVAQDKKQIKIHDSLKNISFEKFENIASDMNLSKEIRIFLANSFYEKAKNQKDRIKIVKSMYWQARLDFDSKNTPKIIDSLILLSSKIDDEDYPAKAHILKSEFLLYNSKILKGLDEAFFAEKLAKEKNNVKQSQLIKKQIGYINIELDRLDIALKQFKEYKSYFEQDKEKSREYLYAVLTISSIYNKMNKPDIAITNIDSVLKRINKENFFYKLFIMSKGISYHLKKEYFKSNILLKDAIKLLDMSNEKSNLTICYLYYGKNIFLGEKNIIKAKNYFKKVDSIILKTKIYNSAIRDNFIQLIEITKKQKKYNEQLYYLNRLIEIDSILNKKNKLLSKKINEKYDTPHLLEEKENIISNLKTQKYLSYFITGLFFFSLLFSIFYIRKLRNDKKKFLLIMENKSELNNNISIEDNKIKNLEIPIEIAEEILLKLNFFEKKQEFLDATINQVELSKKLNTNSSYLSKTINYYKGINFSQYLNDIRIEYAINRLKSDKKFRKFTIKAIANETGFNNAQSFSNAFMAKTGLKPSYFIKKIEEL